ncbi:NAD(P) transhydrogenase subunit alpha, partial [Actinoplanes sp. NPDC051633]
DTVIPRAPVPGGRPPVLVTAEGLESLRPGSVVVDMAAGAHGGNVEGSRPDQSIVTPGGVTVIGAGSLAAQVPQAASAAYSRNVCALLSSLITDGGVAIDPDDEIHAAVVLSPEVSS